MPLSCVGFIPFQNSWWAAIPLVQKLEQPWAPALLKQSVVPISTLACRGLCGAELSRGGQGMAALRKGRDE